MIFPRRIYDLGLSHKAVSVYCYLANRADENGECFPAVRNIAEDLKFSKTTVYRAFKELEKHDLLEINHRVTVRTLHNYDNNPDVMTLATVQIFTKNMSMPFEQLII